MDYGRFYSPRDRALHHSINREYLKEIVQCFVVLFKLNPNSTDENIYGEADTKMYYTGVEITCLIEHPETNTESDDFGPNASKRMQFRFNEDMCKEASYYPEIGDVVEWDNLHFEITNVIQEQHLGGIASKSWSILCDAYLTRNSKLNIQPRQQ